MKLLHREDVIEAGYDLPNTGLCANIAEAELEELKFGGEWVLSENEVVVNDGHEQRYLYMLVSGEVAITKKNDQGNSQQIATCPQERLFGEMAFLSGGWLPLTFNPWENAFFGESITSGCSSSSAAMEPQADSFA